MDVIEEPTGVWSLSRLSVVGDGHREIYGTVRLIRRGAEIGYRAELANHGVIGYYRRLLPALKAVQDAGMIVADWQRRIAPFTMSKQPIPEHLREPPIVRVGMPR